MKLNLRLNQFGQWSHGVAAAAAADSVEELSAYFAAAASRLLDCDRVYVGLYHRDITPVTIDDSGTDSWNRNYDTGVYRQDPFFQMFASTRTDFLLPLSAVESGNFHSTPYYREFYQPSQSFDEITGVFNFNNMTAGFVTFIRNIGAPRFDADNLAVAEAASGATRVVLERLWRLWRDKDPCLLSDVRLSPLSIRERQIAQLLLNGGNAKTIARSLSISPGTARNHIKTIYRKLGVHSQVELLSISH